MLAKLAEMRASKQYRLKSDPEHQVRVCRDGAVMGITLESKTR